MRTAWTRLVIRVVLQRNFRSSRQVFNVTPAHIQDRDAGREVLFRLRLMHPELTPVWADSADAGQLANWAGDFLHLTVRTVYRPKDATGFVVLPRR